MIARGVGVFALFAGVDRTTVAARSLLIPALIPGLPVFVFNAMSSCCQATNTAPSHASADVTISAKWNRFATGWGSWKGAGCYSSRAWRRYGRSFDW